MKTIYLILFSLELFLPSFVRAQNAQLVDVFPLSIGNTWTYRYTVYYTDDPGFADRNDTGQVRYTIVGMIPNPDSTRWLFREFRNLISAYSGYQYYYTVPIVDTATFEIVERSDLRHRLYRNQPEYPIHESVFPWSPNLTDTTSVFRYCYVDTSETTTFRTKGSISSYTFTFKRGVGQISVHCIKTQTGFSYWRIDHTLLSSVITDVIDNNDPLLPLTISLDQNYPNPFNPSTTISYSVPRSAIVSLAIFNTLGQKVASLVNRREEVGYHQVIWNATNAPSGIYFYRLRAGEFVETKKMILLK
jgi:hypothetical protein